MIRKPVLEQKSSLKMKLLISIYVACLIPFFIGGLYLNVFISDWFYSTNEVNTQQVLEQVDLLIRTTLDDEVGSLVNFLENDFRLKNSTGTIRNYSNMEADGTSLEDISQTEFELSLIFKNMKESHENVHFVFMALENGNYMEYPEFRPSKSYDPTIRPWYINTLKQDRLSISDPYISSVTEDTIMSFTKRIELNNGIEGVIGIAVDIKKLTDEIGKVRIGQDGYVIVLNQNDKIIISPLNKEWLLKTPSDIGLENFFNSYYDNSVELLNGEEKEVSYYTSDIGKYTSVAIVPKLELDSQFKKLSVLLIIIYLLTLAIIFYVINHITNRFTKPILEIASSLSGVKDVDVIDEAVDETIGLYMEQNDEIGTIANSIHVMISNMNNSFDDLKAKNIEITEKSNMLAASEEELISQVEEIESQNEYIEYLAYHDSLTELTNRRYFLEALNASIAKKDSGAVILIDLDNFKGINDTLGHVFGDLVLKKVADILSCLNNDFISISRFGGDEFLFLITDKKAYPIEELLIKVMNLFTKKIIIDDHDLNIRFSMGVSSYPEDSTDVEQLIMNADLALYNVKTSGKNNYFFYEASLMESIIKRSDIEFVLKNAIANDRFEMVYQPIVDTITGKTVSYEALLRLQGNKYSPAVFIPIAEEDGSIIRIGRLVMKKVISQIARWRDDGIEIVPVAFNFSARQLLDNSFIQLLESELNKYQLEAKYIEIEFTENIFLENKTETLIFLNKLRSMGIKIAIDDFGTGYSSLSYLTFLPIDKLKLDRSINIKFLTEETIGVMASIIGLAHSLGLEVVAEGIETVNQYNLLKQLSCDMIQGYLFSKPLQIEIATEEFGVNLLDLLDLN